MCTPLSLIAHIWDLHLPCAICTHTHIVCSRTPHFQPSSSSVPPIPTLLCEGSGRYLYVQLETMANILCWPMVTHASPLLALWPEAERAMGHKGAYLHIAPPGVSLRMQISTGDFARNRRRAYVTLAREISRERGGVDKMGEGESMDALLYIAPEQPPFKFFRM